MRFSDDPAYHWIRQAQKRRADEIAKAPPATNATLSDEARVGLEATIAYLSARDARNDDDEYDRGAVAAAWLHAIRERDFRNSTIITADVSPEAPDRS